MEITRRRGTDEGMRFTREETVLAAARRGLVTRGKYVVLPESALNLLKRLPQGRVGK